MNLREIERIYEAHLVYDFPEAEQKPLPVVRRLKREGRYRGFGCYEGGTLLGYTFLIHEKGSETCLVDYFAVCRGGRGKGTGSLFLQELCKTLAPKRLVFEVEDPETAADEREKKIRERRMAFYHSNQVRDTNLFTRQFGVDLRILFWSKQQETEAGIYEELDRIYRFVFGERYQKGTVSLEKRE